MADISALGALQPIDMLDLENYADAKESTFVLPAKGVYQLQAPDTFPSAAFSRTNAGNLSVQIDPTIVGPAHNGFKLRFIKVSAKSFKRGGVTVSQVGDYLRACGYRGKLSDEQTIADAVEATASQVYQARIDWRAYNKATGFSLEGMERFPSDGKGGHLPYVEDPTDVDPETGKPVRVRANLIIAMNGFLPAGV
jgi:hypothetical protein